MPETVGKSTVNAQHDGSWMKSPTKYKYIFLLFVTNDGADRHLGLADMSEVTVITCHVFTKPELKVMNQALSQSELAAAARTNQSLWS